MTQVRINFSEFNWRHHQDGVKFTVFHTFAAEGTSCSVDGRNFLKSGAFIERLGILEKKNIIGFLHITIQQLNPAVDSGGQIYGYRGFSGTTLSGQSD